MKLPPPRRNSHVSVEQALEQRRSVRQFTEEPLSAVEVGQLLWAVQGLVTAGGRRTAPSAAATYPLETLAVTGPIPGIPAGIHRYHPASHELSQLVEGDQRGAVAAAAWNQQWMANAPMIVALAMVKERNMKRFGPHGLHFIDMEVGHAAQNLALQAVALGLGTVMVGAFDVVPTQNALGLPADQVPRYLVPVGHPAAHA